VAENNLPAEKMKKRRRKRKLKDQLRFDKNPLNGRVIVSG
jgi:hypothetical protein